MLALGQCWRLGFVDQQYEAVASLIANGSTAFKMKAVLPLAMRLVTASNQCMNHNAM